MKQRQEYHSWAPGHSAILHGSSRPVRLYHVSFKKKGNQCWEGSVTMKSPVAHIYNHSIWEVQSGGVGVQSQFQLHNKSEASLHETLSPKKSLKPSVVVHAYNSNTQVRRQREDCKCKVSLGYTVETLFHTYTYADVNTVYLRSKECSSTIMCLDISNALG